MNTSEASKYTEQEGKDRGLFIGTYTGKQFYAFDPREDEIDINDIAHALSLTCRFSGHCNEFYSVAQHSVIVSYLVPKGFELEGLLHDAPEAYLTDIPRPIKHMLNRNNNEFSKAEERIYRVIASKYNLNNDEVPSDVHAVDHHIVADEASVLFDPVPDWVSWYTLLGVDIKPVEWREAKVLFLERFYELTG